MIKLLDKTAIACVAVYLGASGALAKSGVSDERLGRHHDLLPFLNASMLHTWWGGGTATIAGQSKTLEVSTQLSPVWSPGNFLSNKVSVSTTLKLEGYADRNFEYTMSFQNEHDFSIIVKNQIVGTGSCFAEWDYDVTCNFEIPSLHHKEVFHFYESVFPHEGYSKLSISACGASNLWGPTALLEYQL